MQRLEIEREKAKLKDMMEEEMGCNQQEMQLVELEEQDRLLQQLRLENVVHLLMQEGLKKLFETPNYQLKKQENERLSSEYRDVLKRFDELAFRL